MNFWNMNVKSWCPRRWKSRSLKRTPEIRKEKEVGDLRTAAFINSLDKIAVSYMELGVFP